MKESGSILTGVQKHSMNYKMLEMITVLFFAVFLMLISTCLAEDIVYSSRELIRNGDFEEETYSAWFTNFLKIERGAAFDGENGLSSFWCPDNESDCYFAQKLPIPSQLNSASLSFTYRVEGNEISNAPVPFDFQVYLARSSGFAMENVRMTLPPLTPIGDIYTATVCQETDWQKLRIDIGDTLLQEAQIAREQGEFVFIVFLLETGEIRYGDLEVHFDNISFKVNGILTLPELQGAIAFFESGEENIGEDTAATIHLLDPDQRSVDGGFNQFFPIWSASDRFAYAKYDLSWNPDSSRIAFVSDHDSMFSPFYADIYTIMPNGRELQRVTSFPMQTEIENGNFPRVTVSGTIKSSSENAYNNSFYFCLKGALQCIPMSLDENGETSFNISDVAVLGDPELFDQFAVIYWKNSFCDAGLEWKSGLTAPVNTDSVDLGTIYFDAANCVGNTYGYTPHHLSWKRDGSQISTTLLGELRTFDLTSPVLSTGKAMLPERSYAAKMQWAPSDDRFLYTDFESASDIEYGIFMAAENETPQLLVKDVEDIAPAWLGDGSGFIFVKDEADAGLNIFQFDLSTQAVHQLTYFGREFIQNISVSPDDTHIVFEKCKELYACEIWIMDRLQPATMWQIAPGTGYKNPAWSPTEVIFTDSADDQVPFTEGSESQENGGCFIETIR